MGMLRLCFAGVDRGLDGAMGFAKRLRVHVVRLRRRMIPWAFDDDTAV